MITKPISIVFSLFLVFSGCSKENINNDIIMGTGNIVSQTQNLISFAEIELRNYCNVEVIEGTENKVEYSDYENIIEHLNFEVIENRLIIQTLPQNILINHSNAKAKVYIKSSLNSVLITGSGNINLLSAFDGISQFTITGSGNIVSNSNSTSASINCNITGSGSMDLLRIRSSIATTSIAGSGDIKITVSSELNALISGSGNTYYNGNPIVFKNITGSGNVIKL